jgi:transposase
MGTSAQVIRRRNRVMNLICRGLNLTEIAEKEGVSYNTAQKDLVAGRKELLKQFGKMPANEMLAELNHKQSLRVQRNWAVIADTGADKRNVLKALENLRREELLSIKKAQLAGILPRDAPEQVILTENLNLDQRSINFVSDAEKAAIIDRINQVIGIEDQQGTVKQGDIVLQEQH